MSILSQYGRVPLSAWRVTTAGELAMGVALRTGPQSGLSSRA